MFSLTRGGPFYHLMRRCRLVAQSGRVRVEWLVAITWLPLLASMMFDMIVGDPIDPAAHDPAMHVRLLITLPMLFIAEDLLEVRCAGAERTLRRDAVVERATWDAIIGRAEDLRDWWVVEAALAIAVLALGQIALWGTGGWSGLVTGHHMVIRPTFTTFWSVTFALPLVQFLMFRWLWRWFVWSYVLARMSRVSLSLNTLHPDKAGGLKALGAPIDAFAVYVAALAAIFSAAWTFQLHGGLTTLNEVSPTFFTFMIVVLLVACGPLTLFTTHLYRARYRDTVAYHGLGRRYVDEFRRKWILEPTGESPLASQDIQSLNDLCGSYITSSETKLYPFSVRAVVNLWGGAIIPMIPVLFATTPVAEIALRFGKMMFGLAP
jgi:hypothetical protein